MQLQRTWKLGPKLVKAPTLVSSSWRQKPELLQILRPFSKRFEGTSQISNRPAPYSLASCNSGSGSSCCKVRAHEEDRTPSGQGGNHSFDADDADEKALAVHHAGGTLLGESNRLAVESEHVGLAVMGQLRTQRESLISSRSLAQKTYGELQDSRSLLTAMLRQSLFSKLILVAIIVFLSLAIVCVLIHRLLRLVRDV
ncbi:putative transmembrane protein [Toxoplasma gondii TgCatPRC2]|uniref:Transmembrane protein n=13 Tax=Toxoplasma gondii TaxID=5811 RepID=A0A125YWR1_TOXGV|nr:hypothetical protein TGME49_242080 [Toxoplasma gondii ME49]EPR60601.1 hypothetical protein TGGT1_242080 [Toxoplasma gondii GT1]ESS31512.1 putative transmembrane protein [Toxoplasma gondii VEG]KFG27931.1 putative transmembrane protein [Toxoplasma gondii p89]KFG32786.1 putative transmembrane protein [Toxoplasma gondii GAB2-2007-GAL-DOM2]KFG32944.1 putative transmembrane protein [Toxoplasma gondii FOU]KFG56777.1 putative transmembrane protein [Toxoplasma gondii RUB]KFH01692.1 putative transm|eukprot:XP_018637582.1 hypothetical protein TGME49_242080 [Toxoplasma gondii ME49]